jgi:hypothetical protein
MAFLKYVENITQNVGAQRCPQIPANLTHIVVAHVPASAWAFETYILSDIDAGITKTADVLWMWKHGPLQNLITICNLFLLKAVSY